MTGNIYAFNNFFLLTVLGQFQINHTRELNPLFSPKHKPTKDGKHCHFTYRSESWLFTACAFSIPAQSNRTVCPIKATAQLWTGNPSTADRTCQWRVQGVT